MAIEVMLMQDVEGLGALGAVVTVKDGYARNYLLPQKLAAPVTAATRRRMVKLQAAQLVEREAAIQKMREFAASMSGKDYTIAVKVGVENKIFGSVNSADVVEALHAQGFDVEKHAVQLEAPIKALGNFEVKVRVHPEVEATIKVAVVQKG
ncbi:MAG: 50S ribosomal protein L9 [bacterium]